MSALKFVVVNSKTKLPDTREMQSYSDTVLAIVPPPSSPTGQSRLSGVQQASSKTVTTTPDRGHNAFILETIAETDSEKSSRVLGSGGTELLNEKQGTLAEDGVGNEKQNGTEDSMKEDMRGIIPAEKSDNSSLDIRQKFPYKPRVLITSNVMAVSSSSSHAKSLSPARWDTKHIVGDVLLLLLMA